MTLLEAFQMAAMVAILDQNGAILAILNLHVALMSPTRIQFNQTYRFMIFKMRLKNFMNGIGGCVSWILEGN